MTNINTENAGLGSDGPELGSTERTTDRRLDLPKSLRGKSIHDIWGPGGPANLIVRLTDEHKFNRSVGPPLNREDLAQLLELYDDEPPLALREIVVRELRNKREVVCDTEVPRSPSQWIERHLLPIYHERAKHIAAWQRRRLMRKEERKKRREKAEKIPTQSELAMPFLRHWLPSVRGLKDKTIANRLSKMKDPRDKKPRAKSAER